MKSVLATGMFLILLESFPCAMPALAQQTSATTPMLPDAPSTTAATTCTKNNGKPCPKWLHRLIGQYPPAPDSQIPERRDKPASFWTYRGALEPPLRTTKEVFHSKVFMTAHVLEVGAMVVACHHKKSGEEWGQAIPISGVLLGLDYLQFRFVGGANAIAAPIAVTIYYIRESAR